MELYYQSYSSEDLAGKESDQVPIIIIPGLFGSTTNWRSFARKLAENYCVIVIDQRNHGESPHANTNSYADMVNDLLILCDRLNYDQVILCGHSMGGKVAMLFSLLYPSRVKSLAVLDIAPVQYEHSHAPYLRALMQVDLTSLASRSDAEKALQETIEDTPTRLFLIQSLVGRPGEYRWRLNLPVLLSEMPKIIGFPSNSVDGLVSQVKTLFLLGGKSNYVKKSHLGVMSDYFPQADFVTIDGAGHWLHAERLQETFEAIMEFLKK